MQAISTAMENGDIKTAAQLNDVLKLNATYVQGSETAKAITASQQYKDLDETIKARTFNPADPNAKMLGSLGLTDAGLGLRYSLIQQTIEWAAAHPNASFGEQQEALGKIGESILKQITGRYMQQPIVQPQPGNPYLSEGPQPSQSYSPAISSTPPAPAAPATPMPNPSQGGSSPQQSTQGSPPPPVPPNPAAVHGWLQSLPLDQQTRIATMAAKRGISTERLAAHVYQLANPSSPAPTSPLPQAAPAPATIAPNGDTPSNNLANAFLTALHEQGAPIGNYAEQAIRNDSRAARLLDFISGPESNGNYNAWFEHGNSKNDLSHLTLNQIMEWQEERERQGSPSTATGRYQFMLGTLRTLKTQLGLKGTEKFTPEFQDNLALQLLKNRGYDRWLAGKMSDATFANNLAYEWASLPNILTGRSAYDGDGLNKASATSDQVVRALDNAKR